MEIMEPQSRVNASLPEFVKQGLARYHRGPKAVPLVRAATAPLPADYYDRARQSWQECSTSSQAEFLASAPSEPGTLQGRHATVATSQQLRDECIHQCEGDAPQTLEHARQRMFQQLSRSRVASQAVHLKFNSQQTHPGRAMGDKLHRVDADDGHPRKPPKLVIKPAPPTKQRPVVIGASHTVPRNTRTYALCIPKPPDLRSESPAVPFSPTCKGRLHSFGLDVEDPAAAQQEAPEETPRSRRKAAFVPPKLHCSQLKLEAEDAGALAELNAAALRSASPPKQVVRRPLKTLGAGFRRRNDVQDVLKWKDHVRVLEQQASQALERAREKARLRAERHKLQTPPLGATDNSWIDQC
ncbi:hypothetical protein WJX72_000722 [[Myrmecia] bisecta]|uniref:Uncharacterized protein n=1 Tax=[Myrmecia] bisecta TaxID=41462 RepID=A0AAW1PTH2_9CHLO